MELHLIDTGETYWGRSVMRLSRPLTWRYRMFYDGDLAVSVVVKVPRGYRTDFASVPRLLWPIVNPTGPWRAAAVVHDWLCDRCVRRPLVDAIFYCIMVEDARIKPWQRCLIYGAVRCYWLCWGKWMKRSSVNDLEVNAD